MPIINCPACSSDVTVENAVRCDLCKDPFHNDCTGLSRTELNNLKKKKLIFYCNDCASKNKKERDLVSVIEDLKREISTLKLQMASNCNSNINNTSFDYEEVILEIAERNKRANNVVIFGLKEPTDKEPDARLRADRASILDIITSLDNDINTTNLKPVRIGKYDANKVRPVKLRFVDPGDVQTVLRNAKKIKDYAKYKNVWIANDRTPAQIKYYKQVKAEFEERKASGETNITIKYIHNVPRIVQLNK